MARATGTASRLLVYTGDVEGGKHYAFNEDVENAAYLSNPTRDIDTGEVKLHLAVLIPGYGVVSHFTHLWRMLDEHEMSVWFGTPDVFRDTPGQGEKTAPESIPPPADSVSVDPGVTTGN